eukprot:2207699-Prymnesium_polylepis.1
MQSRSFCFLEKMTLWRSERGGATIQTRWQSCTQSGNRAIDPDAVARTRALRISRARRRPIWHTRAALRGAGSRRGRRRRTRSARMPRGPGRSGEEEAPKRRERRAQRRRCARDRRARRRGCVSERGAACAPWAGGGADCAGRQGAADEPEPVRSIRARERAAGRTRGAGLIDGRVDRWTRAGERRDPSDRRGLHEDREPTTDADRRPAELERVRRRLGRRVAPAPPDARQQHHGQQADDP